jgi:hypothetical protein
MIFLSRILVIIRIIGERVHIVAGYLVTLLGPRAEIDQLAAIRAKWPVRIIFPLGFLAASRALHDERHRRLRDYVFSSNSARKQYKKISLAKSPRRKVIKHFLNFARFAPLRE